MRKIKSISGLLCISALLPSCVGPSEKITEKPNVIIILTDDIAWGDLGCYGATKVKTPNIDRLAAEGLRFTDAYAPAATCTPTRFSLLTGKYAWRNNVGVANGDAPMSIEPGSFTLPELFKKAGYNTACVGKWHLGLGEGRTDYNTLITPGVRNVGFDYSFYIPSTNDRVPCVYIENDRVVGLDPDDPIEIDYNRKIGNLPTGKENPELLKLMYYWGHDHTIINGISRIGYMSGGTAAHWVDETIADTITAKAVNFIRQNSSQPFFLYFSPINIHEPRTPGERFAGKSDCGVYCDFIEELDWSVGEILRVLAETNQDKNTWIIFTSDNGPEIKEGYLDGALENLNGHDPKAGFRGGKYSLFEAGTRLPFISWWPNTIKPAVTDALLGYIDLYTSFARFLNIDIAGEKSIDSRDALSVILGDEQATQHNEILIQDNGGRLAIRKGDWKYIPDGSHGATDGEYLFNIVDDKYEKVNLVGQYPEIRKALRDRINVIKTGDW